IAVKYNTFPFFLGGGAHVEIMCVRVGKGVWKGEINGFQCEKTEINSRDIVKKKLKKCYLPVYIYSLKLSQHSAFNFVQFIRSYGRLGQSIVRLCGGWEYRVCLCTCMRELKRIGLRSLET
uniref:Uncharacterized protein n=1 Tax=Hippocampus comes TaxID=109280 RepID=A0A3Q3E5J0_HIPCM